MDVEGRWQSRFTDYVTDNMNIVMPFPVDAYLTLSARLAYHFNDHLTASVAGEELGHARLYVAGGTPVERRVYATVRSTF
jgi:hypothetical protein